MKKIMSIVLAISAFSSGIVFADGGEEEILLSVKSKINPPDELTEFETGYYTDENGITTLSFSWYDKDNDNHIGVETDSDGNIKSYSYRRSDWYSEESAVKIDEAFGMETIYEVADEMLERCAPDLFSSDTDRLTRQPYEGVYELSSNAVYGVEYVRTHNDIEVKDNNAYVTVRRSGDDYIATRVYINWDYSKVFSADDGVIPEDVAQNAVNKASPLKLRYEKNGDGYVLEYVRDGIVYVDASTGEETEEFVKASDGYVKNESTDLSSGGGSFGGKLSESELAELSNTARLKSADELFEVLRSVPEFGIDGDNATYTSGTYKSNDKYYTSLYIVESKSNEAYSRADARFNALTGELISFERRSYAENENDEQKAYEFINKYYSDKLAECEKSDGVYVRKINGIPYMDNYIAAEWENDRIKSFRLVWDEDISAIPAPEGIVSEEDALRSVYEAYPLKLLYITTAPDEPATLCYTHETGNIKINAFDGEPSEYAQSDAPAYYDDLAEHWVKNIADTLCDYGIKFDSVSLLPDEKITRGDFLKLIYSGVFGMRMPGDYDYVYATMTNRRIIEEDDAKSDEPLSREEAICFLLRAAGIREVAEIDGIFICDFDDAESISKDKFGYCAVAKGLGVVKGCDNMLRPKESITKAEACVLIYNYLTR